MHFIGFLASVLTIAAFVPQAYQAVKTKRTRDISLPTYLILIVTGTLWSIYGFMLHSSSIYITNIAIGLMAAVICTAKIIEG